MIYRGLFFAQKCKQQILKFRNCPYGFEFETIKVREAIFETLPFESVAFNVNEYEPFVQAVVSKLQYKLLELSSMQPSASMVKLLPL